MLRLARRRAVSALAAALLLGAGAARSLAADRLALTWMAPAECPGAADVKAEVDRLLGASHAAPAKALEVSAAVSRDAQGTWHVRLETPSEGTKRAREVHGASCRAVSDAAALIIALIIDPEAVAAAPSASAAPSTSASATPSSATPSTSAAASAPAPGSDVSPRNPASGASASTPPGGPFAPAPSTTPPPGSTPFSRFPPPVSSIAPPPHPALPLPSTTPISFRAGFRAGADIGSLPGVSAGIGALAALTVGAQRIEIGFDFRPSTKATLPGRPTAGGSIDLLAGWAGTCRNLLSAPIELAPCIAIEAGRLHAAGFGVTSPGTADQPWIAASAGGLAAWSPASRLAFLLRIDAVVPLARPTFVLEGAGPVHTPSPVAGRASAGFELRF